MELKNIESLMEELKICKEATELLQEVWLDIGPYGLDSLSGKTLNKLNDFMKWDDSE